MRFQALAHKTWLHRRAFRPDTDEQRRRELRRVASELCDASRVDELELYESCKVVGIVTRIRLDPINHTVETTISDGTGSLIAQLGPNRIQEITSSIGSWLTLEGVARLDSEAHVMMVEPLIEMLSPVGNCETG
ncbi:MAG: hypothetical protein ACRDJT_07985 [Actinomycetota bacterium]